MDFEDQINIIMRIPRGTIAMEVTVKVQQDDGSFKEGVATLGVDDIFEMRKKFLDNLYDDDYDAIYELTEEGRRRLCGSDT